MQKASKCYAFETITLHLLLKKTNLRISLVSHRACFASHVNTKMKMTILKTTFWSGYTFLMLFLHPQWKPCKVAQGKTITRLWLGPDANLKECRPWIRHWHYNKYDDVHSQMGVKWGIAIQHERECVCVWMCVCVCVRSGCMCVCVCMCALVHACIWICLYQPLSRGLSLSLSYLCLSVSLSPIYIYIYISLSLSLSLSLCLNVSLPLFRSFAQQSIRVRQSKRVFCLHALFHEKGRRANVMVLTPWSTLQNIAHAICNHRSTSVHMCMHPRQSWRPGAPCTNFNHDTRLMLDTRAMMLCLVQRCGSTKSAATGPINPNRSCTRALSLTMAIGCLLRIIGNPFFSWFSLFSMFKHTVARGMLA